MNLVKTYKGFNIYKGEMLSFKGYFITLPKHDHNCFDKIPMKQTNLKDIYKVCNNLLKV
jgi:hypothetical protein